MRLIGLVLALGLAGCGATRPPEGVEWIALRDLNDQFTDVDDPTNRPPLRRSVPAGMIRAVDVSPDGVDDWVIDYGRAGGSHWCGTGGCHIRLYVSTEAGLVRALDRPVLSLTAAPGQVAVSVHPIHCGDGGESCTLRLDWEAASGRLKPDPAAGAGWTPLGTAN
jgi:hypothetical protein